MNGREEANVGISLLAKSRPRPKLYPIIVCIAALIGCGTARPQLPIAAMRIFGLAYTLRQHELSRTMPPLPVTMRVGVLLHRLGILLVFVAWHALHLKVQAFDFHDGTQLAFRVQSNVSIGQLYSKLQFGQEDNGRDDHCKI